MTTESFKITREKQIDEIIIIIQLFMYIEQEVEQNNFDGSLERETLSTESYKVEAYTPLWNTNYAQSIQLF